MLKRIRELQPDTKMRKPVLDVPTRWGSVYDMLKSVLDNKRFAFALKQDILSDEDWESLEVIVNALKPARITTKVFRKEQLVMSEFYFHWKRCKLETMKIKFELTKALVQAMEEREKMLFDNDSMIATMYLDPRVNASLSKQQEKRAEDHLQSLFDKIEKRQNQNHEPNNVVDEEASCSFSEEFLNG